MKKLTVMLGSPRKNSISTEAAQHFIRGAEEIGCEVKIYNINDLNIKGCQACGSCRENGTDCVVLDDFQKYLEDFWTSDAILVTSPNYYSNISGPMITFLDRHYCLLDKNRKTRLEKPVKIFGIFAQAANYPLQPYKYAYHWYMSIFERMGMKDYGHICIGSNTNIEDAHSRIYEMGKSI